MEESGQKGERLVVFALADREYALGVRHVAEVVPIVALTPVPEAPEWVAGVMNLRGRVIPVLDLRARLGLARRQPDLQTPILVAQGGDRTTGLIVDAVVEVLPLPVTSMSPPGDLGSTGLVGALATTGERMILVLDAERLIAGIDRFVPAEV